jgi:23S rRNA (cytidine1920-2'-O)/16S rRNA (cytidine1409-2'-O)-methyltransferase
VPGVPQFVSRGGLKLDHALTTFNLDVTDLTCADLGCSTGGFVDCMLQRGAAKVYAVDTGYGVLDYKLRKDPRVVVKERSNAMHVELPERVDFISIDASWTRQDKLLPNVAKLLKPGGRVVTLIKPHYEADKKLLRKGILPAEEVDAVVEQVRGRIDACGFAVNAITPSPILGGQGNIEVLALLHRID